MEKSNPNPKKSNSNHSYSFKKKVALSLTTCLLLGIVSYDFIKSSSKDKFKSQSNFYISALDKDTEQLQISLNQSLNELNELKRMLFVKQSAPESNLLTSLKKQVREREIEISTLNQK